MIEIELPDGTIAEFPDGTPNEVIEKVLAQQYSGAAAQEPQPEAPQQRAGGGSSTIGEKIGAITDGIAQGLTLGFSDEIAAGLQTGFGKLGDYDEALLEERARMQQNRDAAGGYELAGQIAGGVGGGLGLLNKGITATRALPGMLGLTADGAAIGAVNALGTDQDVKSGAALGAGLGAAGGVLGNVAQRAAAALNRSPKGMSVDELGALATEAYQQADDAGVIFTPQATSRLLKNVGDEFTEFGFHPVNQPGANVALGELDRLATQNVTMKGLDQARRIASGGYNPMNKTNNKLIGKVREEIDDLIANPQVGDVLAGDPKAGAEAYRRGRDFHGRKSKITTVQERIEKAIRRAGSTGSGGNVDNAIRQELRKILDSKKLSRGFTADEKEAIDAVVQGGPVQNLLRLGGKLSPSGNGLMAALGIGGTMVNPAIGLAALGGMGSKAVADNITTKNVENLVNLIAQGGKKPSPTQAQKFIENNRDQIIRMLMSGGVTGSGSLAAN